MHYENTYPIAHYDVRREPAWLSIMAVAGALALGAFVRVPLPFTPVPLTLQTLPVLVAAFAVGRNRAAAGAMLYLLLGMVGAPILTQSFGVTAGYLAGFVVAPYVVTQFRSPLAGIVAATAIIYALGAGWLSIYLGMPLTAAVAAGVLPFLAGDVIKAAAAYGLVKRYC
jgi:biotin transport system substrate-specific component